MDKQTESLIESISSGSYKLGQIVQLELVSKELMKKAENFFANGKDELANVFREESKKALETANLLRCSYENKEKKSSDDAWSILDNCIGNIVYPSNDWIKG